jgi:Ca2+-binding EF-hand superfamily protein
MKPVRFAVAIMLCCIATAPGTVASAAGQSTDRTERRQEPFDRLDVNRDGVITREEWRGSDEAFTRRDVNRDGVLSGNEIWRSGAANWRSRAGRDNALTQTFRRADVNRDGILSREEWASGPQSFNRVDVNQDGVITEPEFLGEGWEQTAPGGETTARREAALGESFRRADSNHDGIISKNEWASDPESFARVDVNDDGVVTQPEFMGEGWDEANPAVGTSGTTGVHRETKAFQSGYDRGLADGRQAGKEDRDLRNRWDLEGQRELEQADAGYSSGLGSREEYQAGYRAGFRAGYGQGFGKQR